MLSLQTRRNSVGQLANGAAEKHRLRSEGRASVVGSRFAIPLSSSNSPAVVASRPAPMEMQTAISGLFCDAVKAFGCPLGLQFCIPTRCAAREHAPATLRRGACLHAPRVASPP